MGEGRRMTLREGDALLDRGLRIVLYGAGRVGASLGNYIMNQRYFPVDHIGIVTRSQKSSCAARDEIRANTCAMRRRRLGNERRVDVDIFDLTTEQGRLGLSRADVVFLSVMHNKNPVERDGRIDRSENLALDLPQVIDASCKLQGYEGMVIVATGPIEPFCHVVEEYADLKPSQVVGFRNIDSTRFNQKAREYFEEHHDVTVDFDALIVGHHGDYLYPDEARSSSRLRASNEQYSLDELFVKFGVDREGFYSEVLPKVTTYFYSEYRRFGGVSMTIAPAAAILLESMHRGEAVSLSQREPQTGLYTGTMSAFRLDGGRLRAGEFVPPDRPPPSLCDRQRKGYESTLRDLSFINEQILGNESIGDKRLVSIPQLRL